MFYGKVRCFNYYNSMPELAQHACQLSKHLVFYSKTQIPDIYSVCLEALNTVYIIEYIWEETKSFICIGDHR